MELVKFSVPTTQKEQFIDITARVQEAAARAGLKSGAVVVFAPHTTAAVTINENADPDVVHDVLFALDHAFPDHRQFRHSEGNSTAHVKSSVVGCSLTVIVENGRLALGTWQGIYFCEFDGPRTRSCWVKCLRGSPDATLSDNPHR
jgi:secondary thiamine-phosphate synthase enzyme